MSDNDFEENVKNETRIDVLRAMSRAQESRLSVLSRRDGDTGDAESRLATINDRIEELEEAGAVRNYLGTAPALADAEGNFAHSAEVATAPMNSGPGGEPAKNYDDAQKLAEKMAEEGVTIDTPKPSDAAKDGSKNTAKAPAKK